MLVLINPLTEEEAGSPIVPPLLPTLGPQLRKKGGGTRASDEMFKFSWKRLNIKNANTHCELQRSVDNALQQLEKCPDSEVDDRSDIFYAFLCSST